MPSAMDWGLNASIINLGSRDYPSAGGGLFATSNGKEMFSFTDPERCNSVAFDILYDESIDSMTLTIPRLLACQPQFITKDRMATANQRLSGTGIEFDYINGDHGGNIVILKQPDGATEMEIYTDLGCTCKSIRGVVDFFAFNQAMKFTPFQRFPL